MDQLYRSCFDDFLALDPETHYARVRSTYEADYLANVMVETRMYPGIAGALAALSQIGKLACVTNKPEHISRQLLLELGVGELFDTVVGGDSCEHAKPHPVMLATAALRCNLDSTAADSSVMIGDTQGDVDMGRAYGARTVWCAWGYVGSLQNAADADALTPADLLKVVG